MIIHVCDKCGCEIDGEQQYNYFPMEFCFDCADKLRRWLENESEVIESLCISSYDDTCAWHDMKLGYPERYGRYLVTINQTNNDGTVKKLVFIAKYYGGTEWLTANKLSEPLRSEVLAWAELPQAFEG